MGRRHLSCSHEAMKATNYIKSSSHSSMLSCPFAHFSKANQSVLSAVHPRGLILTMVQDNLGSVSRSPANPTKVNFQQAEPKQAYTTNK